MEVVYASLVTAISGIIIALIQKFRKENKQDHGVVTAMLEILHDDVKDIDNKLDEHIESHLKNKL